MGCPQPVDVIHCPGSDPLWEFFFDLETFPTWHLLGFATSALDLVELSSGTSSPPDHVLKATQLFQL